MKCEMHRSLANGQAPPSPPSFLPCLEGSSRKKRTSRLGQRSCCMEIHIFLSAWGGGAAVLLIGHQIQAKMNSPIKVIKKIKKEMA